MNYLQTPIQPLTHRPYSRQIKSNRKLAQSSQHNQMSPQNYPKNYFKELQSTKVKSSHGNRLRPLVKINKNLENAFPSNFFSNSKPQKSCSNKKQSILNNQCFQLNLQPMPSVFSSNQTKSKQIGKYQSIELKKSTLIDSSFICSTLNSQEMPERLKIKPLQSLRTSLQKKHNITFCFEKNTEECLPQTAQTLENTEEQELFNVTFGNGFSKQNTPNGSSVFLERESQKHMSQLQGHNEIRIKNAVSLELKRGYERKSINLSRQGSETKTKNVNDQKSGSISERGQKLLKELPQRRKIMPEKEEENPFMKIRLDMEEILSKKTPMFPRVNSHQTKRQRVSKLAKMVC